MTFEQGLLFLSFSLAAIVASVRGQCNPTQGSCEPIPGFTEDYSIDFTTTSTLPSEWIQADYEPISFGPKGVEFTLTDPTIAHYIWTKEYLHYGHVEVVMQTAPGIGVISSAVLMSDDLDEIDWEFSGNDFGQSTPTLQTNWFGKGVTGWWDRGTQPHVATNLTKNFHTFTLDWLPDSLTWSVDGTVIRTLYARDGDSDTHQYPQTPARFHLGVWDAGGPDVAWWTVNWAGGSTDVRGFPYTAYVKSVNIRPYKPCPMYKYMDTSGSSGSVKCVDSGITEASSSTTSPSQTNNAPAVPSGAQPVVTSSVQSTTSVFASSVASTIQSTVQSLLQPSVRTSTQTSSSTQTSLAKTSSTTQVTSSLSSTRTTPTAAASPTTNTGINIATQTTTKLSTTTPSQVLSIATTPALTTPSPAGTSGPTQISCPSSNQASYISSGRVFQIDCSTDYANGDLQSAGSFSNGQSAPSFQSCVDRCASFADGKCTAVNFLGVDGSGACYLKGGAGTASSRPGVQGARFMVGTAGASAENNGAGTGATGLTTASTTTPATTAAVVPSMTGATSSAKSSSTTTTAQAASPNFPVLPSSKTRTTSTPSSGFQTVIRPATTTTGTTSMNSAMTPATPAKQPLNCAQDNCLRNLMDARFTKTASAFCSTFTTRPVATMTTSLEAVVNCEGSVKSISSACSCFMAPTGK
ncbi:hypothetical protein F5Y15DRAFT_36666 [Xylariaceae sp. FL0016]|nr:hypothetical protein F5Y15DRAFT_36666 [Xylariaceae sp. FL0016]